MAYDLLIKNGLLVDGTGAPARRTDVAIPGGTIVEIGGLSGDAAAVIERGGRRLTSDPAEVFGIRDRVRLAPGLAADVAIFDAGRIGSTNRGERRFDLCGGAKLKAMLSRGVECTVVNGVVTWHDGKLTGTTGGQVRRS
jgi:N-acyl-D-aspartate/D-glutamate deacylase